jgi:divalent metal cation (Fe/Co/Zn/Cd) transporter
MFVENARFLLGRSPGEEFIAGIRRTALAVPGVLAINDVRAEFVGPETVHTGIRIAVRRELSVAEAASIAKEVERRVHAGMQFAHCFVQAEPAR